MNTEIPVRRVDTEEYMKIVRGLLAEGREVPLVVTGNSMMPFLIHERDKILIRKVDRPLKKGDMAFFQRKNGQYIMHRIHFIRKDQKTGKKQYYFIGDAQQDTEGPIEETQIFGLITAVERKGKHLTKNSFWWLFFQHIWLYIIPFRKQIIEIYSHFF